MARTKQTARKSTITTTTTERITPKLTMAATSGAVFSSTLQNITTAKLAALDDKRSTFEGRHKDTISSLAPHSEDRLARVTALLAGVKRCFDIETTAAGQGYHDGTGDGDLVADLNRLQRFLEQAAFDPSLSVRTLGEWEATLQRYLDVQLERYRYATLYGQLVTEWLSPDKSTPASDVEMSESFDELPGGKRLEAREAFEAAVFTPASVDEEAIKHYLSTLFTDDEDSGTKTTSKALTTLRESTKAFEHQIASPKQFTISTVARSIRSLLKGDLFPSGEKRSVMKSFQANHIILSEIADVLNMRMSALPTWTWAPEDSGVPIEQRRKLNGRFDVFMHEDLLQAIFLQFLGTEWSVFFKTAFKKFRRSGAWTSNFRQITRTERKRREYYLGPQETDETLARKRRRTYRQGYFVYSLVDSDTQEVEQKDGEEEAEFGADEDLDDSAIPSRGRLAPRMQLASKAARKSAPGIGAGGAMRHRKIHVVSPDDEESDDGSEENYATKKPMEKRQDLLHLLSTEAAVNTRMHGSFAAFRGVFDELQNSLSHQAIGIILNFYGVSEKWQDFFSQYLEAPLRFVDDDDADTEPRKRMRGAPASHTLSDVFSETMLFCVDFSINRRSQGAFLYRLADDFWFWSHDAGKTKAMWNEVEKFADTMALPINMDRSGSISVGAEKSEALPYGRIRWGMMFFDPETLRFGIDQKMVDEHVEELKKQLAAKKSVFDWIQVWNAYANTFFASNFGKSANCFSRQHVDDILTTHKRIQESVFDGQDVVQYLKSTIADRFGVEDVADGFLFFPVELGGLELQSPFVSPLQIRNRVTENPSKILEEFEANEKERYHELKAEFDKGNEADRDGLDDPAWKPAEGADEFISFEEYTKYREQMNTEGEDNFLLLAYNELLEKPGEGSFMPSPVVEQALKRLEAAQARTKGILPDWHGMEAYWKWIAQLYGPEMIERFGGLTVVESGLLPIGMVGLFRDQKVKWQG